MSSHILAIDIGGTNTKMGILTPALKVLDELVVPTNAKGGAAAATRHWLESISAWRKNYKIGLIGIGSPGPLDTGKGIILETPNLRNWANFSFTEFFTKNLGAPCFIENDANCAALGEWHHDQTSDLVMITLGTGVGSGVVSQGKLIRGVKGLGVEAGHMTIDMNGPVCGCGKRGCLEAFVGGRRFVERYNAQCEDKVPELDVHAVFKKAIEGNKIAIELVDEWVKALAVGIGNLVNIFNPSQVTLTGGVSRAFPLIEKPFHKILLTQAFEPSLKCTKVTVSKLQEKAGLFGAALWAQTQSQQR